MGGSEEALTPRERDVLDLVRLGWTDGEIADELVLSVRTVNHHVGNILQKLGAKSRRELRRGAEK